MTKFFVDSANPDSVRQALEDGLAVGVTTNPTIMVQDGAHSVAQRVKELALVCGGKPLSVQINCGQGAGRLLAQADSLKEIYNEIVLKVPIVGPRGECTVNLAHSLARRGHSVNITACVSVRQAFLAAQVGARYVSFFAGKAMDAGADAESSLAAIMRHLRGSSCELILGSVRDQGRLERYLLVGPDVVTLPFRMLYAVPEHPSSELAVEGFQASYDKLDS